MHALMQVLDEVGSTNDHMRERAEKGAPHGSAVAARRQTAGRGRRGHVWESPAGNLYLSVLLRPEVSPSRLPGLAAACGLGVLDGLGALGVSNEAQLKWPNDVLAHGRKLAGILVEAGRDQAGGTFAVCGVGLNLESAPRALSAICLAELGTPASFSAAAEALRDAIAARVDAWSAAAGKRPLVAIDNVPDLSAPDCREVAADAGAEAVYISPVYETSECATATFRSKLETKELIKRLKDDPRVAGASPNYIMKLSRPAAAKD